MRVASTKSPNCFVPTSGLKSLPAMRAASTEFMKFRGPTFSLPGPKSLPEMFAASTEFTNCSVPFSSLPGPKFLPEMFAAST
jgi:hypothetical protein